MSDSEEEKKKQTQTRTKRVKKDATTSPDPVVELKKQVATPAGVIRRSSEPHWIVMLQDNVPDPDKVPVDEWKNAVRKVDSNAYDIEVEGQFVRITSRITGRRVTALWKWTSELVQ